MTTPLLEVDNITLRFGGVTAINDVSFDVQPDELFAIIGPNGAGKTSIFNRLTGLDLKVTNYPGVTVERQEGHVHLRDGTEATVIDIPGTYSLSGRSAEEQIAIAAIAGLPPHEVPDLLVMTIDATQLSRNLYLLLQAIELNLPTVVALTMTDTLAEFFDKFQNAPVARGADIGVAGVQCQLEIRKPL